jgi:hypothetical protein
VLLLLIHVRNVTGTSTWINTLLTTYVNKSSEFGAPSCRGLIAEKDSEIQHIRLLISKVLRLMKKQPQLLLELLFWKTREEW